MNNEVLENEELKEEEFDPVEKAEKLVKSINQLSAARKTETKVFTTLNVNDLEGQKKIFNLENHCDYKINDCKGQSIRVVDVLIKNIQSKLAEPKVDEETGEVQEYEFKKICILIDDQGKSYVTASKLFTLQMARYLEMFGIESIKNGLEIKIIEKEVKNSSNKSLGFELL